MRNEFKIGDLVKGNTEVAPFGVAAFSGYGIVMKILSGGSHRKNQSLFIHWHGHAIDTWVVAPKLIKVAEAKNECQ
jgi:hypothetical protein